LSNSNAPSHGPLITAIASAIVPGLQLLALFLGLKINMTTVLAIIVPAVTLAMILVAVAIAWIFVLIGRLHRQPAKIMATSIFIGITMVEVMVIIGLAAEAGKPS
jgi:hypothetical protein